MNALKNPANMFTAVVMVIFALTPFVAPAIGETFYVTVFARIMIWGIAAVSLNLIMGYGGLISFGHAVYLGIGGYTVGILAFHGGDQCLDPVAARHRPERPDRADLRGDQPADQGCLFYHDHPGAGADDLFPVGQRGALWQR